MRVFLFDMLDAREVGDRQIVLRLVDNTSVLRVQSPVYGDEDFARNLGEVLAAGFQTELQWVGPSAKAEPEPVDQAKRWCPECEASTVQDRLSTIAWMCTACGRVMAEAAANVSEAVAVKLRRNDPPKNDGLTQLALFS